MKIKTLKSISKRFKKNSKGKIKYKSSNLRHLLTKKSSKKKRQLGKTKILKNNKNIFLCMPYK